MRKQLKLSLKTRLIGALLIMLVPFLGAVLINRGLLLSQVTFDVGDLEKETTKELPTPANLKEELLLTSMPAQKYYDNRDSTALINFNRRRHRLNKLFAANANIFSNTNEQSLFIAALLHDIGKIAVPIEILTKPGPLNKAEFSIIKTHPQVGHNILKNIDFPWPVAEIVYQSHERVNGSGYPRGLTDKEILKETKIMSVADVDQSMSSHRPYRPAFSMDEALSELTKARGILYDTEAVDACLNVIKKDLYRPKKAA